MDRAELVVGLGVAPVSDGDLGFGKSELLQLSKFCHSVVLCLGDGDVRGADVDFSIARSIECGELQLDLNCIGLRELGVREQAWHRFS